LPAGYGGYLACIGIIPVQGIMAERAQAVSAQGLGHHNAGGRRDSLHYFEQAHSLLGQAYMQRDLLVGVWLSLCWHILLRQHSRLCRHKFWQRGLLRRRLRRRLCRRRCWLPGLLLLLPPSLLLLLLVLLICLLLFLLLILLLVYWSWIRTLQSCVAICSGANIVGAASIISLQSRTVGSGVLPFSFLCGRLLLFVGRASQLSHVRRRSRGPVSVGPGGEASGSIEEAMDDALWLTSITSLHR
jgi:hypothetical protein